MTLRARPHLHYAPVSEGLYINGPRTQFVISGPQLLYRVADTCVPLLEAGTTEDELVTALGSERARPVVRRIVEELRARGLLLDLDALTVPEPSAEIRARYPEALAHLETECADPYAVFQRLRTTEVLLCGPADAVLPAARGLHRAGVTGLTLATPDPDAAAATASRLGMRLLPLGGTATLPDPAELPVPPDAALYCPGADDGETPRALAALLPAGAPVVPVRWDGLVAAVGPVSPGGASLPGSAALVRRAAHWAVAEATAPAPHPTAAALAGALAGQLLFDTLAGIAPPGEAHVLHGEELTADRVSVSLTAPGPTAGEAAERSFLTAAPAAGAEPVVPPTPDEAVEAVTALTGRWTGPVALLAGEELPQMPLALREMAARDGGTDSVVAWAEEQRTATVAVALAALRAACPSPGAAAAGLTEEHWLLDGALRLMADEAVPYATRTVGAVEAHSVPLLRMLEEEGMPDPAVTLLRHPGLDWTLAEVRVSGGPRPWTGVSWGRDDTEAVHRALATALARHQTHGVPGAGPLADGVHTDALLFADAAEQAALRKRVADSAAAAGLRYEGTPRRPDPVTGALPLWSGTVRAVPLAGEPQVTEASTEEPDRG
ncbi:hypothetical protein ACH4KN_14065 [Streptomyces sp. NPDC017546]|uniref:hypothetical protein n=1 Tax=unclassified Streptomyces TaxID=2593676 RepID=UPI002361E97E|nr:hypothetical protein [Streptomyces sp. MMBL 11-1]